MLLLEAPTELHLRPLTRHDLLLMAVEDGYRAAGAIGGKEPARLAGAVAAYEAAGGTGGEDEVRLMLGHLMEHRGADYMFEPQYGWLERQDRRRGRRPRGHVMWTRPIGGRRISWRKASDDG